MKVIIYRYKETGEIIREVNDYERLIKEGKSHEDIVKMLEEYNEHNHYVAKCELVELDDIAEFYRNLSNRAYNATIDDMRRLADSLDDLAIDIREYIRRAEEK